MTNKTVSVLGSTGSIGRQTMEVVRHLGLGVDCVSGNRNSKAIEAQCREFGIRKAWIGKDNYKELKTSLADTNVKVVTGDDELCEMAFETKCDILCNSLLGVSGLKPTLAALDGNHPIALSNKEVLVAGGSIVTKKAKEKELPIIPVDSEHSAIFQCLGGKKAKRIYLTASGGPFFGKDRAFLEKVTPEMALAHPNWNMGAKITVDSASLMNKGLEIIEAVWLFGVRPEDIEVVVQRESIIHSMVGFDDNTVIAQLARPDMRLAIQYALTYPERLPSLTGELDFPSLAKITFASPDDTTFPLLSLAKNAIKRGGNIPAAMSASNEIAVEAFLEKRIMFTDIFDVVTTVTNETAFVPEPSLDDIMSTDKAAREATARLIAAKGVN